EPTMLARDMTQPSHPLSSDPLSALGASLVHVMFYGAVMGACISAALLFGDELGTARPARIAGRTTLGFLAGGMAGAIASFGSQILFLILGLVSWLIARVAAWALAGAGIGLVGG